MYRNLVLARSSTVCFFDTGILGSLDSRHCRLLTFQSIHEELLARPGAGRPRAAPIRWLEFGRARAARARLAAWPPDATDPAGAGARHGAQRDYRGAVDGQLQPGWPSERRAKGWQRSAVWAVQAAAPAVLRALPDQDRGIAEQLRVTHLDDSGWFAPD